MKEEYKDVTYKYMHKWPSWCIRLFAFLMLPIYLLSPLWREETILDAVEQWWDEVITKYVQRENSHQKKWR